MLLPILTTVLRIGAVVSTVVKAAEALEVLDEIIDL